MVIVGILAYLPFIKPVRFPWIKVAAIFSSDYTVFCQNIPKEALFHAGVILLALCCRSSNRSLLAPFGSLRLQLLPVKYIYRAIIMYPRSESSHSDRIMGVYE